MLIGWMIFRTLSSPCYKGQSRKTVVFVKTNRHLLDRLRWTYCTKKCIGFGQGLLRYFVIKLLQFISIKINFSGFHLPVVKNFQVETCWINEWLEKALTRQLLTYDFSTSNWQTDGQKQKISIGIGIANRAVKVGNFLLLTCCNILWFIFLIKENWIGCLVINTCNLL